MRYIAAILIILNVLRWIEGDSQVNMKPFWWNIMRVEYTPGEPPPPPLLGPLGYGVNATGASVSDPTITVTSTGGGTGSGTLYHALFTALGGTGSAASHKNIVFNLPGAGPHTINVNTGNRLEIVNLSFVTIDGGNEAIIITNETENGLSFEGSGAHHIIVKNLHFVACGNEDNSEGSDGANAVGGSHDIAFMNCAFYFNSDGNIDVGSDSYNVTIQYSIIGDHYQIPGDDGTGGMLITGVGVSAHHNLFNLKSEEEGERAPLIHGNYSNAFGDIRNNIVYNYGRDEATGSGYGSLVGYNGSGSGCGCYGRGNIVNNYYYTTSVGVDGAAADGVSVGGEPYSTPPGSGYSAGNISGNGFNFNATSRYTNHAEWPVASPFQLPVVPTCIGVQEVLANVGPAVKTAEAAAFIAQVTNLGSCTIAFPPMFPDIRNGIWYSGVIYNESNHQPVTEIMQESAILNSRRKKSKFNI